MPQTMDQRNRLALGLRTCRREMAAHSPLVFAEIYLTNNCHAEFSRMHTDVFDLLQKVTRQRKGRVAVAAPRGHAKSTIVSLAYVLWCVLYEKERLILIVSNTTEQAATLLKDVKYQLKENHLLITDFPEICRGKKPNPWRSDRIQLPNGTMICTYGAGQSPRGIKNDRDRPGLIIADDLENEEQAQSEEQREKLTTWFRGTLLNTGHPHTNVVVVGTVLHQDSLLANLIDRDRSPGWTGKKYQAVESFGDHPHLWEQWSAIFRSDTDYDGATGSDAAKAFFKANRTKMLEGAQVLWPKWEPYYSLMVMRETEGRRSFQSEKQNDPIDPSQCIFRPEIIAYWDDQYRDLQHLLESLGQKAEFHGACDPSLGKTTKGDYTAIVILVRDRDKKVDYVIAADLLHCNPSDAIERIVQYARMYPFRKFAVESNSFQELIVNDLKRRITAAGARLDLSEITSRSNKQSRIAGLEPYVQQGHLRFCRKHRLLLDQLLQFPLAKNDDGPDALEMAMQVARERRHTTRFIRL